MFIYVEDYLRIKNIDEQELKGNTVNTGTTLEGFNSTKESYIIPTLPLTIDLESKEVLKKANEAARALAELKGVVASLPRPGILLNTLSLQEAKDSSAIENIITTHDELYQSDTTINHFTSIAAKEVHSYDLALKEGFEKVKNTGFLTSKHILSIQERLEGNDAGFRTQSGTALKNDYTGEIVYTPPQDYDQIVKHMKNLELFMNENELSDWDPLIKMAVIHHQFESIHPFFDGNGRTGRIINILYLVKQGLLDTPILYLSRYINQNKSEYYHLLQAVREEKVWEKWVMFMLEGVEQTSHQAINLVQNFKRLMLDHKSRIRSNLPKIYSQDLLNNLFSHPYTKISFLEKELLIHRNTATKYLNQLVSLGILTPHKIKNEVFYINHELLDLFSNVTTNQ